MLVMFLFFPPRQSMLYIAIIIFLVAFKLFSSSSVVLFSATCKHQTMPESRAACFLNPGKHPFTHYEYSDFLHYLEVFASHKNTLLQWEGVYLCFHRKKFGITVCSMDYLFFRSVFQLFLDSPIFST